jgi:hypothetical protein
MSEQSNYPRLPPTSGVKRKVVRVPRRLCKEVGSADPHDIANLFEDSAKMFANGASVQDVAASSEQAGWSKDMSMWAATMAQRFGKDVELMPERPRIWKFLRVFVPLAFPFLMQWATNPFLLIHVPFGYELWKFLLYIGAHPPVAYAVLVYFWGLSVANWADEKGLTKWWAASALLGPGAWIAILVMVIVPSSFDYQPEAA